MRAALDALDHFVIDLAAGRLDIPASAEVTRRPRPNGGETLEVTGWLPGLGPMTVLTKADGQVTTAFASITEPNLLRRADLTARWGEGQLLIGDEDGSRNLTFDLEPTGDKHHVVVTALLDDDDDVVTSISVVPFQTET
jgi:hypothetical protein